MSFTPTYRLAFVFWVTLLASPVWAQDNVYFGNLHAHTSYSDGSGTPDEAFRVGRKVGLDFMAVTEHNHKSAEGSGDTPDKLHIARDASLYEGVQGGSLISAARSRTVPGKFVALFGQEVSTIGGGNHVNVFDVPHVVTTPNKKFKLLVEWLAQNRDSTGDLPLMQLNHPALYSNDKDEYGRDDFGSEAGWITAIDAQAELIEVLNGPAMESASGLRSAARQEKDFFYYLNLGFHLAPSVGHDNHKRNWGSVTDARVAVIAPELTKAAIISGLRARHAYATEDKNLRMVFRYGSALQGDIVGNLPSIGEEMALSLSLRDDDEPEADYRVDIFSDTPGNDPIDGGAPTNSYLIQGDTTTPFNLDGVRFAGSGQYVVVRVTQISEHHAEDDITWSAPIWFSASGPAFAPPAAPLEFPFLISRVLADPSGSDFENEKIWVRNVADAPAALQGWVLRDLSGNIWELTGTLAANEERMFQRHGQPLSLNNAGDTLELVAPSGKVVQVRSYGPVERDQVIPLDP